MCHLFHSKDADLSKSRPGFSSCINPEIFFANEQCWQRIVNDYGSANLGFTRCGINLMQHVELADNASVGLKLSYLACMDPHDSLTDKLPIPDKMEYNESLPLRFDFESSAQAPLASANLSEHTHTTDRYALSGGDLELGGEDLDLQCLAADVNAIAGRKRLRDGKSPSIPRVD